MLLVSAFGAFLAFLDSTIVNIAFPNIVRSFPDSSLSSLSWVLNAYNIVFAALLVAAGRIGDLLGRRRLFVGGVLIFTVASALCAAAATVDQLIGFRVLQGVGAAMLVPASLGLVLEGFTEDRRAHGVTLWGSAAAVASGLGPPIGGALVAAASWRLAFLVNVPLGLVAIAAARRGLVESRAPGRRRAPDLRGAVLLGASIGLLTLGVVKGNDWGWASAREIGSLVLSAVALAGFAVSSRVHPAPILDAASLRVRAFSVGNLATFVAGMGFYAYLLTHVLWLSYVWHYSLLRAGLAVAPGAFVAAVVAAVLGKVADRHGHRLVLVPGALVWASSLLWYSQRVGTSPAFLREWLPGQVLGGIGAGAVLPVLMSAVLAVLPDGGYATASAVVTSARQLGGALGISILVVLIGTPTPRTTAEVLRHGWTFCGLCFVVVAVLTAVIGRTVHAETAGADAGDHGRLIIALPVPPPQPRFVPAPDERPQRLGDLPMFAGLPARVRARLDRGADVVSVPAGAVLFSAGDDSDALYIVRSGRLQVVIGGAVVAEAGRGEVLGELGLLTGGVRSATVRAIRDTSVVRLRASEFDLVADAVLLRQLARQLATRVQALTPAALPESEASVIAVIGLDAGADVERVATALVDRVRRWRRVLAPGRIDADGLERAERTADKVVLVASAEDAWATFCLRAADRVVLVSASGSPPDRELPRHADLVLLGPSRSRTDVLAWHARVAPRSTTVLGASDDLALALRPLAARLAQRSLGLVLAGGGARAMAHLGVLDVLADAGIAIDRAAGTSMGAIVAAFHAVGLSAEAVDAAVYEEFVRRNPINDYVLPTKSLIRGRKTVLGLERLFGDLRIEELPREFCCASTDLLRRESVIHRSGRLSDALAASIRLPGLYPPYLLDGRLLVDGGVLENLPVAPLATPREGPVVAVNISFGGARSGASGPPRVPALGDTLMRTMLISSADATLAALRLADVVITPSAEGVGLLEWHQIDRVRAAGRVAAEAALPAIEAALAAPAAAPDKRQRPQRPAVAAARASRR